MNRPSNRPDRMRKRIKSDAFPIQFGKKNRTFFLTKNMSDILTDYRDWRSSLDERIGTHSAGCHMWPRHERCMIHRLARELERTREYRDLAESDAAVARLAADNAVKLADEVRRLRAALVAVATQDGTLSVSDGRLFVDVDGVEELAFDYAPPPHATPSEDSEPIE